MPHTRGYVQRLARPQNSFGVDRLGEQRPCLQNLRMLDLRVTLPCKLLHVYTGTVCHHAERGGYKIYSGDEMVPTQYTAEYNKRAAYGRPDKAAAKNTHVPRTVGRQKAHRECWTAHRSSDLAQVALRGGRVLRACHEQLPVSCTVYNIMYAMYKKLTIWKALATAHTVHYVYSV